jgi:hypothetical protein
MLQNTVADISELRQVRINAELEVAKGGTRLKYQQYIPLLLSAATAYDKVSSPGKMQGQRQHVFIADTSFDAHYDPGEFDLPDDEIEDFNVDTCLVNVTARRPPIKGRKQRVNESSGATTRNFVPREAWLRIPKDVRDLLTRNRVSSPSSTDTSRQIHLTNTFVPIFDDEIITESTNDGNLHEHDDIGIENPLLAFMSNQKNDTNGLQKAFATNLGITKKGSTNTKVSDDTISLNGSTYRKINVINITYRINRKTISTNCYSLVDRGADGGVFGDDV